MKDEIMYCRVIFSLDLVQIPEQVQQPVQGYYPRNRLSPRYINIAITRYNELLGPQHKAQNKKERKKRRK
jgi:hypothetical protein